MLKRMALGLFFVLVPSAVWAQTQESYLPSKSQLYFRWDGMQMHQAAYDKTAVGKMMQGDTGKFLDEFWKYAQEQLQNAAQNEPKVGPLLKDFGKLVSTMHQNGLVVGLEVERVLPPAVQAVIVFPKAAGESGTLLPLIQKIAEEAKAEVTNTKVGKRFVNHVDLKLVKFAWWGQGNDALLFLGTTDPVAFAKDIDAKKTGIAGNPVYKKVIAFKDFTTASRGYFDMASVLKVGSEAHPAAGKIIDELGLKGMKNITFVSGFDGPAERSVVEVDVPGPRSGLLSLGSQRKISLKDLPVLPNDLSGFSASSANFSKSYDVLSKLAFGVVGVFAPDKADEVKDAVKAFEGAVGVDINKDLFANFDDLVVTYSSPSDGILGIGRVMAIQIKDGKKLANTLDKLVKAIPVSPAGEFSLKRKAYRGGEIMQLQTTGQFNAHLATFGIYKNWLIYSGYPQPIKGFILRQEGELPAWKAEPALTKVLAQFPSEFNAISVSDPRPTVQTLLAATPFVINILNSAGSAAAQFVLPGFRPFDLELIPHAQDATRHLFPNVTISIDDGKKIRSETRGSLVLPF